MLARIQPGAKISPASVMIQGLASSTSIASAAAANAARRVGKLRASATWDGAWPGHTVSSAGLSRSDGFIGSAGFVAGRGSWQGGAYAAGLRSLVPGHALVARGMAMRAFALPGRSGGPRSWQGDTHLDHLSGERIEDQHGCISPVAVPVERRYIAVRSRLSEQLRRVGEPFVYSGAAAVRTRPVRPYA